MNTHCEIKELTEDQFAEYGEKWLNCLNASDADPIFSSWAWCFSWWETWSQAYSLTPLILVIYSNDNLIGIAPLYLKKVERKFGPTGEQIQFIGNSWRISPSVRSEYTNFIIKKGHEEQVERSLSKYLDSLNWVDLVTCDHQPKLNTYLNQLGVMLAIRDKDKGISLPVTTSFESWVNSLGKNTRLKAFNRRNYLKDRLTLEEIPFNDVPRRAEFFNALSKLRFNRWEEKPSEAELNFHNRLAEIAENHIHPIYSILKIDDEIVSVVYDIIAGDRRYNLQSAYIGNFDKKVSLGLLHLGFTIQDAFEDPNIHTYDFLVGSGKNSFYKERFMGFIGQEYELLTSQVSKTNLHKMYLKAHMLAKSITNKFR